MLSREISGQIYCNTAFHCHCKRSVKISFFEKLIRDKFGTVVAYWLDYGTIKNLTGEVG